MDREQKECMDKKEIDFRESYRIIFFKCFEAVEELQEVLDPSDDHVTVISFFSRVLRNDKFHPETEAGVKKTANSWDELIDFASKDLEAIRYFHLLYQQLLKRVGTVQAFTHAEQYYEFSVEFEINRIKKDMTSGKTSGKEAFDKVTRLSRDEMFEFYELFQPEDTECLLRVFFAEVL